VFDLANSILFGASKPVSFLTDAILYDILTLDWGLEAKPGNPSELFLHFFLFSFLNNNVRELEITGAKEKENWRQAVPRC
jgi:hypothetical protein